MSLYSSSVSSVGARLDSWLGPTAVNQNLDIPPVFQNGETRSNEQNQNEKSVSELIERVNNTDSIATMVSPERSDDFCFACGVDAPQCSHPKTNRSFMVPLQLYSAFQFFFVGAAEADDTVL